MTISKCILFATVAFSASFANAALETSCDKAANSSLTGSRAATVKKADQVLPKDQARSQTTEKNTGNSGTAS